MSRDIKFRAWHKPNKEIVYFDNHKAASDQYQSSAILRLMAGDDSGILMQFTGFKDSDGIDIYEGDICEINSLSENYLISFWYGKWVVVHPPTCRAEEEGECAYDELCDFTSEQITVVGNQHENSGLLDS